MAALGSGLWWRRQGLPEKEERRDPRTGVDELLSSILSCDIFSYLVCMEKSEGRELGKKKVIIERCKKSLVTVSKCMNA